MKIFINGSKREAVRRMFPVWKKMGHNVVKSYKEADVQLSVIKIKNYGLPTVLRLDGIYYDKADNFNARNAEISRSHKMADAVVYQSYTSKKMCEKYLDKRKTKVYDIIYNGVDPDERERFVPHNDINVVSCSKWRRPKRLPEMIELFGEFLNHYPKAKLHIVGPLVKGTKLIKHKNVIYHNPNKKINFKKIREIYKTCDIYLHLCKKDSCPSSVVEAIVTGIPVVTTNACGGATEMCRFTKDCVIIDGESESLEPNFIYKDPYNKIPDDVKEKLLQSMLYIAENKYRVTLPKELYIETIAKKYIEIMERII